MAIKSRHLLTELNSLQVFITNRKHGEKLRDYFVQ